MSRSVLRRLGPLALVLATIGLVVPASATGAPVGDSAAAGRTGTVAGRFTDPTGAGLPGAQVVLQGTGGDSLTGVTDRTGHYRVRHVPAGTYTVLFSHEGRGVRQYGYGQTDPDLADLITVRPGLTSTVDDQQIPGGAVRVSAVDALTGRPVPEFRAQVGRYAAEGVDGSAIVFNVDVGTVPVTVTSHGYVSAVRVPAVVRLGQLIEVAIALTPTGRITTTVVDAVTGAPVAGMCLKAVVPTGNQLGYQCPVSGPDGVVVIDELAPGPYRLFAIRPFNEEPVLPYGAQWVGAGGGTGDPASAVTVTVVAAGTVNAPVVKLDGVGLITGVVKGVGGAAVHNAAVTFGSETNPSTEGKMSFPVAANGRYTVDLLGPYAWPLHFEADDHAPQWSGNVGRRANARKITVRAGQAVRYSITLVRGTQVTVDAVEGGPSMTYRAHDAATGEDSGSCETFAVASCKMLILGPQPVKFELWGYYGDDFWHGGPSFATATSVPIPATGTKTVTIVR